MKIEDLKTLRIGNLVLDHNNDIRTVYYITKETIGLDLGDGATQKYQENPIHSGDITDVNFIEIAERLLIKLGYKKDNHSKFGGWLSPKYNGMQIRIKKELKNGYIYCISDYSILKIKYVHQLQNLYFALTGKELEYVA